MDNLTHSLVGAAMAKAGADRTTPLAMATLVLAANAPDVDVLAYLAGEQAALAFRRGVTHGVPALLVLPFLVAAFVLGWDRWVRRRRDPQAEPARAGPILLWSWAGVATHPVLDAMNSYGMRWWLPLEGSWSYVDALFIVDPWLWLVLGGAVFLAVRPSGWGRWGWGALAALTTALVLMAELGPGFLPEVAWLGGLTVILLLHRAGRGGRRLTRGALTASVLYVLALALADGPERSQVTAAALAMGLSPREVMVAPEPGRPLASSVEVRTRSGFVPGSFHWLRTPRVELRPDELVPLVAAPEAISLERRDAILRDARRIPRARDYLVWSRLSYARILPAGDGWRVRFGDARYDGGSGSGGLSGVEVVVAEP